MEEPTIEEQSNPEVLTTNTKTSLSFGFALLRFGTLFIFILAYYWLFFSYGTPIQRSLNMLSLYQEFTGVGLIVIIFG
jgi:hypothetical protein